MALFLSAIIASNYLNKIFMKKLLLFFCLISWNINSYAQLPACCQPPEKGSGMIAMLESRDFNEAHMAPEPFAYETDRGNMVSFETLDGKQGNAFYVPSPQPTDKVLIIFHEWWGLNDYIKREAVRWQDTLGNIDVYAVDMFDGKVAATADEAQKLSSGLDPRRADNIVKGIVVKAGKDKLIGTLGWCLGGTYAFAAAVQAGAQARGCVMYYGFPEKDVKKIKPLTTDVLFIWGTKDKFITRKVVDDFGQAVSATGHKFMMEPYEAVHAFANPSNPQYNVVAATQAKEKAVAFLKEKLLLE